MGTAAAQEAALQLEAPGDLDGKCLRSTGVEDDAADGTAIAAQLGLPHLDVEVFELLAELG